MAARVGDVVPEKPCLAAAACEIAEKRLGICILHHIVGDDAEPGLAERARGRGTQAAPGAGDERDGRPAGDIR
jgi:hypothetical protein